MKDKTGMSILRIGDDIDSFLIDLDDAAQRVFIAYGLPADKNQMDAWLSDGRFDEKVGEKVSDVQWEIPRVVSQAVRVMWGLHKIHWEIDKNDKKNYALEISKLLEMLYSPEQAWRTGQVGGKANKGKSRPATKFWDEIFTLAFNAAERDDFGQSTFNKDDVINTATNLNRGSYFDVTDAWEHSPSDIPSLSIDIYNLETKKEESYRLTIKTIQNKISLYK
jgi:hypothetical protein